MNVCTPFSPLIIFEGFNGRGIGPGRDIQGEQWLGIQLAFEETCAVMCT